MMCHHHRHERVMTNPVKVAYMFRHGSATAMCNTVFLQEPLKQCLQNVCQTPSLTHFEAQQKHLKMQLNELCTAAAGGTAQSGCCGGRWWH